MKDLSEEIVAEMTGRLESDPVAQERFYQAFGLDPKKIPEPRGVTDIRVLFPYTPLGLLKDSFEALQLYDLAELFEKEKRRTLRPALPLKEMEKITNESNRPIKFYSKIEVLIIDSSNTAARNKAKEIGSFFNSVNLECKIAFISTKAIKQKLNTLRKLKNTLQDEREEHLKKQLNMLQLHMHSLMLSKNDERPQVTVTRSKLMKEESELKERLEEQIKWREAEGKHIEEKKEQKTGELQKDKNNFQMAVSTLIDKWMHNNEGWLK